MYTAGVRAGRISEADMARVLSEQPARLFGMYPQKGVLAVGSDGDIVIFDPDYTDSIRAEAQYQNVDYTPYEGFALSGRADTVLLCGEVCVQGGAVVAERRGRYVKRGPAGFWR